MKLNKALFWDIHMDTLDKEKHARFIIKRIVSRGTLKDWMQLKTIYSMARIKQEVLCIRSLDQKTFSFLSIYFGEKKTRFRCCS